MQEYLPFFFCTASVYIEKRRAKSTLISQAVAKTSIEIANFPLLLILTVKVKYANMQRLGTYIHTQIYRSSLAINLAILNATKQLSQSSVISKRQAVIGIRSLWS